VTITVRRFMVQRTLWSGRADVKAPLPVADGFAEVIQM
jgi:hypothetical protein